MGHPFPLDYFPSLSESLHVFDGIQAGDDKRKSDARMTKETGETRTKRVGVIEEY